MEPKHNSPQGRLAAALRSLDIFSAMTKVPSDLRTTSLPGGAVSAVSLAIILVLFISELSAYLTLQRTTKLSVDVDSGPDDRLRIHLNVDFTMLNCDVMGVDALDVGGNVQLEITNHMFKTPIDHAGVPIPTRERTRLQRAVVREAQQSPSPSPWPGGCASCMGAESAPGQCCNTCAEVRAAYEKRGWLLVDLTGVPQCAREGVTTLTKGAYDASEGCNIHGYIEISKVAGRIHITPGHSFSFHGRTMHDLGALRGRELNLSHRINSLAFGDPFPGRKNPLDGVSRLSTRVDEVGQHEYFVRIVPTTYRKAFGGVLHTNQYSQSYFFRKSDPSAGGQLIPGLFLSYDLSPIHIEVVEERRSFFHFVVQLCAIIGGVFTVAGMFSSACDGILAKARKRRTGKII